MFDEVLHYNLNTQFTSQCNMFCCYYCPLGNVDADQQLATAPTNGSVVLWDLQKMTKSKICQFLAMCMVCMRSIIATHNWMHMYCTEICRVHFRASWILTHTCVIICHVVTSVNLPG